MVRHLRNEARANIKKWDDSAKQALGIAQRKAADAIDGLIERNLDANGMQGLAGQYRKAREFIAKSHDLQTATNPAGDVNMRVLAGLARKGKPLTGALKAGADLAGSFLQSAQNPATLGGNENLGILDILGAAGSTAMGRPEIAGLFLGRPAARGAVLSQPYQRMIGNVGASRGAAPFNSPLTPVQQALAIAALRGRLGQPQPNTVQERR